MTEYGDSVWDELDEIDDGIRGKRLRRTEGYRPILRGAQGAHTVVNRTDADVRYVMVGAHASPDIIEYPDTGTFVAGAKTLSQRGDPFFVRLPLPEGDIA